MLFGLNTGIDKIQYTFGDPNAEWDLVEDELPPRVFIDLTCPPKPSPFFMRVIS